eukprot:6243127-Amphidinium_carterae.1
MSGKNALITYVLGVGLAQTFTFEKTYVFMCFVLKNAMSVRLGLAPKTQLFRPAPCEGGTTNSCKCDKCGRRTFLFACSVCWQRDIRAASLRATHLHTSSALFLQPQKELRPPEAPNLDIQSQHSQEVS